jgi:DNA mismatch repair ATPase MutL
LSISNQQHKQAKLQSHQSEKNLWILHFSFLSNSANLKLNGRCLKLDKGASSKVCAKPDLQWTNPVFTSLEPPIPLLGTISKVNAISLDASDFQTATVISQVDRKFIFISIHLSKGTLLALVDQHAADERYRLETIIQNLTGTKLQLSSPIEICFSEKHLQILNERKKLQDWGVELEILESLVRITEIPAILDEVDPVRWRSILLQYILEDGRECPLGMMNIFCSKACRSVPPC